MSENSKNYMTPVLIVLLVVAAFALGSMWTKVKSLEGNGAKTGTITQAPQAPNQPPPAVPLTEEQFKGLLTTGVAAKGKTDAKVTIVEFSDFQCPYCGKYSTDTYPQLMKDYGSKIQYIFHDYPLSFHQFAQKTAEVARCANEQGKFWQMHDLLYKNQATWSAKTDPTADFTAYAGTIGLNKSQFNSCLSTGKYTQAVKDDAALGNQVGVDGTPAFFINGERLVGAQPYESFKAVIDKYL